MPSWYGGSALNPDDLVPKQDQWRDQWDRVRRWYERTKEIENRSKKTELSVYDDDILIAFFQNCNHLKDWLQSSRPDLKDKLETLFSSNFEMKACRNICDGYKHKNLTNPTHPDADFNWYREFDSFEKEIDPSKPAIYYRVAFLNGNDIKKYDVFDLISKCYHLWGNFINDNGLSN